MESKYFIAGEKRKNPIKLHYKISGNGPEKILAIGGILGESYLWKNQVSYLMDSDKSKYQIVCLDYRGIGNSEYSNLNGVRDISMDIEDLFDHLKWDKVNLVSHCFGSFVCYDFALYAPNRIKSLLISSIKPPYDSFNNNIYILSKSYLKKDINNLKKLLYSKGFNDYLKNKEQDILKNDKQNKYQKSKIDKKVVLNHFESSFKFKIKEEDKEILSKRDYPITLIYGTNCSIFSFYDTLKLFDHFKPENFSIINGCGHSISRERPNDFNFEMLKTFNSKRSFKKSNISIYDKKYINNKISSTLSPFQSSKSFLASKSLPKNNHNGDCQVDSKNININFSKSFKKENLINSIKDHVDSSLFNNNHIIKNSIYSRFIKLLKK